jgi:site-specific DNA-methyltransferase (adenine-specific)
MLSQQIKNGVFYLGDCFEAMKEAPDNCVDMVMCDLPYGSTRCKWDVILPFDKLWAEYKRIAKPNAAIVLTGSEPFSSLLRTSNLDDYRYDWTWDKVTARGHLVAKKRPMAQSECVSVFYKSAPNYNPQMIKRPPDKIEKRKKTEYARTEIMGGENTNAPTEKIYDEWYPKTIISISNADSGRSSIHPTQKPVALFEYLIKTYTNEGDLILDNCAGSGTTAIACENTLRKWVCIEKDETYANAAIERIRNHAPKLD